MSQFAAADALPSPRGSAILCDEHLPFLFALISSRGFVYYGRALSLPKTLSVNGFLLYFTNRSSLEASDIFEKESLVLGTCAWRISSS